MKILEKRIYEKADKSDGFRILADRLWARGMKKENVPLDFWAKEIAPSTELRKSYHSGEINFTEFRENYLKELQENAETKSFLNLIKNQKTITLLTAVKEVETSELPILKEFIEGNL